MLIADAQVHIWAASTPERPWPALHAPHRPVPFSKDELLREMDAADVHRAMLVPPNWEGGRNDLGLEATRLYPDRFVLAGRLDVNAPDARKRLATWRLQPGMLALRFTFKLHSTFKLNESSPDEWIWAAAEAAAVPVMISSSAENLPGLDQVAARYDGLKLVIDPPIARGEKDESAFSQFAKLLLLAKRPNIAVKVSGLPYFTTDSYPYRKWHPHVRRAYDAFGPKRIFWGTDFTKLPCTYRQAVTMFSEEIPWLTAQDKEWIMGRALCEWIGWDLP